MNYREIFKGALETEINNGKYRPKRFSEKQYEFYSQIEKRAPFAKADAGVRLEFSTDTDKISFSYNVIEKWDWWYHGNELCFSVFENDIFTRNIYLNDKGSFEYSRKENSASDIVIYLPASAALELYDFVLGNYKPNENNNKKLLLLGDSISQGVMNITAYSSFANIISRNLKLNLLNQSVGGNIYEDGIFDFSIPFKPDYIILAMGINDTGMISNIWDEDVTKGYTLEKAEENIKKCMDNTALQNSGEVFVITPMWIYDRTDEFMENFEKIRDLIRKEALKRGFNVIDGLDLIPADKKYFEDHCHPNDLGFHIMAENFINITKLKFKDKGVK